MKSGATRSSWVAAGLAVLALQAGIANAADPAAARTYFQPLVDGIIANWADALEPIENEAK